MLKKACALFLISMDVVYPAVSLAGAPQIPGFYGKVSLPQTSVTAMPVLSQGGTQQGVASGVYTMDDATHMTIQQTASQAIIDWSSFNIGANSWVKFNQQGNQGWVALNRINDANPTQIFGHLSADGKIYLINQNGILFAPGSQVNVHTLVASSLKMNQTDFANGLLQFQADPAPASTPGVVSNQGTITTDQQGSVFLLGPQVENGGKIDAPLGQVGLAAGTDISITSPPVAANGQGRMALVTTVNKNPGTVTNMEGGSLSADGGLVGMYGGTVQQNGLIRSVTSVKVNGQIELLASDRIVTGANSVTETPVSSDPEAVNSTYQPTYGSITLAGIDGTSPAGTIELNGSISSPAGNVTLLADQRAYLAAGSSIDVSGLWSNEPASANLVTTQLNSVTLRDYYNQKNGALKGSTVSVDAQNGSSIGDVSGALGAQNMNAVERSTTGGNITIKVASGDLITQQGSKLSFAGGGYNFAEGNVSVSKLYSGNKVYDIGSAPANIAYDGVLGNYQVTSQKFGLVSQFQGLYYGGSAPLNDLASHIVEGSNAGSLSVSAPTLVLDGALNGSVVKGAYQTLPANPVNSLGNATATGLQEPVGGALTIGLPPATGLGDTNMVTSQVTVKSDVAAQNLSADSPTQTGVTNLSARNLNSSGLSSLTVNTNGTFTTEQGVNLQLASGGSFTVNAGKIDHEGAITVPAGQIVLNTVGNGGDQSLVSRVYLGSDSVLSAAGERVDDTLAGTGNNLLLSGNIGGGSITLSDSNPNGEGVVVNKGALVDVSGGYRIDQTGKLTGGDAGAISVQGSSIVANGNFRGLSLPGNNGGSIIFHADTVEVFDAAPSGLEQDFKFNTPIPATLVGKFSMVDDQLSASGITQLTLQSRSGDLTVDTGATLVPSLQKLTVPVQGGAQAAAPVDGNLYNPGGASVGTGAVPPDAIGKSSVTLSAGVTFTEQSTDTPPPVSSNFKVSVQDGAAVKVAPSGSITLTSANDVDLEGRLVARAGNISLDAKGGTLTVGADASLMAGGYNRPNYSTVAPGVITGYTPLDGGKVTLTSDAGSVRLAAGSIVDVSGSVPVETTIANGTLSPAGVQQASNPGTLAITFVGDFQNSATISAKGQAGLPGGSLTLKKTDINNGLTLSADDFNRYLSEGFDNLAFQSSRSILFSGDLNATVGRRLTLDAPEIAGVGNGSSTPQQVSLSTPWLTLSDSVALLPPVTPQAGNGVLTLTGVQGVNVIGDLALSGFQSATVSAPHGDLVVNDRKYQTSSNQEAYSGRLASAGDLTLKADRLYPGMNVETVQDANGVTQNVYLPSDFTINSGGKVSVLPADKASGPVMSAGGSLTINAQGGIDHEGEIDVPLGTITLNAPGSAESGSRVFLAPGSVLSTAGSSTPVAYGFVGDDGTAYFYDKTHLDLSGNPTQTPIGAAPGKGISVSGNEVIVGSNAQLDISGGGGVMAYNFQPGVQGTYNPFSVSGRYLIVPGTLASLPGSAIYLSGGQGMAAGVYSVIPAQFAIEYAALPGALVVSDLGTKAPSSSVATSEGISQVVSGYATERGTGSKPDLLHYYSVGPAAQLLQEGSFTVASFAANDAGSLKVSGATTVLNGILSAGAAKDGAAGSITLSGSNVSVLETAVQLPAGFNFSTPVDPSLSGTCQVAASTLSGQRFSSISLGSLDGSNPTSSVTIGKNITLEAQAITLSAQDAITVEEGAKLAASAPATGSAVAGAGTLTLTARGGIGEISIGAGAQLAASGALNLDAKQLDLQGGLSGSSLTLASDKLLVGSAAPQAGALDLNPALLGQLDAGFADLTLKSRSDIVFGGSVDLTAQGTLTLDAARLMGDGGSPVVTATAQTIKVTNSGASAGTGGATGGSLTLNASGNLSVGQGNITDGFGSTTLAASNEVAFVGKGSLNTTGGDLLISAARITATPYQDPTTAVPSYQAANFTVNAGYGAITLVRNGSTVPASNATVGGSLSFQGRTIVSGVDGNPAGGALIDLPAGSVSLTATGIGSGDGVFLKGGTRISAQAAADGSLPGGSITLRSDSGQVNVASGATLDVSAPVAGDAGSITLIAPTGSGVVLAGQIVGSSAQGKGGSLTIDSATLNLGSTADPSSLGGKIASGGFTEAVHLRDRSDQSVTVDQVKAHDFQLTADSGSLVVQGTIDASGANGGRVELNAGQDLTVNGTIRANATGAGGSGGQVILNDENSTGSIIPGQLTLAAGSVIDVSGAQGGSVAFRAVQNGGDVNITLKGSTVTGASQLTAEAFKTYKYQGDLTFDAGAANQWENDASTFMSSNGAAISSRLQSELGTPVQVLAGIEVKSSGNLTLSGNLDTTSWRPGGEPGVLTLRAGGNLNINGNLVDHPTSFDKLNQNGPGRTSWGYNLVAGSDLASADPMAVVAPGALPSGSGNLNINQTGSLVYSESAPINLASAHDTVLGGGAAPGYMLNNFGNKTLNYTVASYSAPITGEIGGSLLINNGGAIQSALGAIDLNIGGDLNLGSSTSLGSIRTTGAHPLVSGSSYSSYGSNYWEYQGGGDINLEVGGAVAGSTVGDGSAWEYLYKTGAGTLTKYNWSASYGGTAGKATSGLATMGGGSLTVKSGGSFTSQAGAFGNGDLTVYSGGDLSGRFLVNSGTANLHSAGNFGGEPTYDAAGKLLSAGNQPVLEAFGGQISVVAQGSVTMGAVYNPTLAMQAGNKPMWNLGYTDASSLTAKAVTGDLVLTGDNVFNDNAPQLTKVSDAWRFDLLPGTVSLSAGNDLRLTSEFAMAPSLSGNLSLSAGRDINGLYLNVNSAPTNGAIYMLDMSPATFAATAPAQGGGNVFNSQYHEVGMPARTDNSPITVTAGRDIANLQLSLPKQAEVSAGRDISNIAYTGQNLGADDVSWIKAGRNITFSSNANLTGDAVLRIEEGGAGSLLVEAGGDIDLGSSQGIKTFGNAFNANLGSKGSDLFVVAGAENDLSAPQIEAFFNGGTYTDKNGNKVTVTGIRKYGVDATDASDPNQAAQYLQDARKAMETLFFNRSNEKGTPGQLNDGTGSINMVSSQISTSSGKDDIYILTRSALNVGKSSLILDKDKAAAAINSTGIDTAQGGAINILSGGDLNVNESRVMTYDGGDITLWSQLGDINAGRGSKTAISASPPKVVPVPNTSPQQYQLVFQPPMLGSGVRAVSFEASVTPGDLYIFAPNGMIDGGEAGMTGHRVVGKAKTWNNLAQISSQVGSVGVPSAADGTVSIGALGGTGVLAANTLDTGAALGQMAAAKVAGPSAQDDDFVAKLLDVKVLGFDE